MPLRYHHSEEGCTFESEIACQKPEREKSKQPEHRTDDEGGKEENGKDKRNQRYTIRAEWESEEMRLPALGHQLIYRVR